jgi:hypothetical protein
MLMEGIALASPRCAAPYTAKGQFCRVSQTVYPLELCFIRVSLAAALTATYARDRHGRQWPADRVNEQRTRSCLGRECSVKDIDLIGECIPFQLWIADGHRHFFGDSVAILQEGNNRVRRIVGEAVFAITPLIDELPGSQVTHDPLGPVSKEQGRVCQSVKCHRAIIGRQPVGALNKQGFDAIEIRFIFFAYGFVPFAYTTATRTSMKSKVQYLRS